MKSKVSFFLAIVMVLSLCACGNNKIFKDSSNDDNSEYEFSDTVSEETSFDENNIGEIYFHQTDAKHILTCEDNFQYVDNEILLVASNRSKYADVETLARDHNAEIVGWIEQTGDYQLQTKENYTYDELEEIALSLEKSDFIQDAYINFVFETNENKKEDRNGFIYGNEWEDDLQNFNDCKGKSWGIEAIEVLAAWDVLDAVKKNVNPVKVGLVDSAFDDQHEDLQFAEIFYNVDVERDHGTHVAGTIAARTDNQEGICGVYPYGAGNLYGVSCIGLENYSENSAMSLMFLKIAYSELILRNVKVINSSLGLDFDLEWNERVEFMESNAHILGDFLNRLLGKGYDFVLITSAGNKSNRANSIVYDSKYNFWTTVISKEDYPDVYDRIVVVGALDSNFNICDFSNGGDGGNIGEGRVDICAPGETIFSTVPNNKYDTKKGTSMAAPHVSGVAAMVWSANNDLTGAEVKEILCNSRSLRCNKMIDAYMALQKATRGYDSVGDTNDNNDVENGGILCWVVSAKNVNTKVSNAIVTITNTQNGEEFTATTDSEGHFELFAPEGQYSLSVKADNYEDYFIPDEEFIVIENGSINYLSDWIKMEPTYSDDEIFGVYKGSYFVNQEEIGLTLTVYDEGGRYKAIFDFYNLPLKNNTKRGSFYMDVSYDVNNGEYFFKATDWIKHPSDYKTIDLRGTLSENILSGNSPVRFSVALEGDVKKESTGLEFELSSNAEYYVVVGFGECTDTEVVIPSKYKSKPVGAIGKNAFKGSERKSIILPDSIIHIGDYAFSECINLSEINLPEGLFTIGTGAFNECKSLLEINLPNSLTSIGAAAFRACINLGSVVVPENVTTIGNDAFKFCIALESIKLPNSVLKLGSEIFYECTSLKKVYFPEGIERIDSAMCCQCESLEEIYLPASVNFISGAAFRWCPNLKTVYYGGSYAQFKSIRFYVYLDGDFDWLSRADIICNFDVSNNSENITDNGTKIVVPTAEELELDNISEKLSMLLMWHWEYDSSDNPQVGVNRPWGNEIGLFEISNGSLSHGFDENVFSSALPLNQIESMNFLAKEKVFLGREDPRKKFFNKSEFAEGELNSDGTVNESALEYINPSRGYYTFPQKEMEWLIEDVWNMNIETISAEWMYLSNGNYYYAATDNELYDAPLTAEDVRFLSIKENNGMYELSYQLIFEDGVEMDNYKEATIALKESENGYRFWSIYKIN